MRVRKLILVLLIICISPMVSANEVAMVTGIQGQCLVTIEGDTAELELAEMLSVGSKVAVGKSSSLKLLHISEDKEYSLPANSNITIKPSTIEGSAAGKKIELASIDINLGESATEQAGTTDASRLIVKREAKTRNLIEDLEIIQSSTDNKTESNSAFSDLDSNSTQKNSTRSPKTSTTVDRTKESSKKKKNPTLESIRKTVSKENTHSKQKDIKSFFALPTDLYISILKDPKGYSIVLPKGISQLSSISRKTGDTWLIFSVTYNCDSENKLVNLNISSYNKTYCVKLSKQIKVNVISALRLEQNKQWFQAAAIWFKLLSDKHIKANEKSIKKRLEYLRQKIIECAK